MRQPRVAGRIGFEAIEQRRRETDLGHALAAARHPRKPRRAERRTDFRTFVPLQRTPSCSKEGNCRTSAVAARVVAGRMNTCAASAATRSRREKLSRQALA